MATVEEALTARLKTFPGLSALVGTRVYPVKLPQSPTYPAVSYQRTGRTQHHAMGADANVREARFQVSGWDPSYATAKGVATQMRLALDRWRGTQSNGVVIQDTLIENEMELDDEGIVTATTKGGTHALLDIVVFHEE